MEVTLTVIRGKTNKKSVPLVIPATIGRSREADLTIAHPMVSRRHCEIVEVDGQLVIRDLESLNGTIIAEQRVQESPLPPGEEFSIGPIAFRVEYEYAADPSTVSVSETVPVPQEASRVETPEVDRAPVSVPADSPEGRTVDVPDFGKWDQMAAEAVEESQEGDEDDQISNDQADNANQETPSSLQETSAGPTAEESTIHLESASEEEDEEEDEPDAFDEFLKGLE